MKLNEKLYFPVIFFTIAVACRICLFPVVFPDYTQFYDPWMTYLRVFGPESILQEFSPYNSPYLLLLWLGSLLTPSNMLVIKGFAVLFDLLLALGVLKTVEIFKPIGNTPYYAATVALILPTVVINSAAWGQNDNIIGALAVWSIYFCLKDRNHLSWIIFGISFAVKMQAIFLAPFLLAVAVNRRKGFVTGPLLAVASCLVLLSPTLLVGDTPGRIIGFLIHGTDPMLGVKNLAWWVANLWQWFPNNFDQLRLIGVALGFFAAVALVVYGFKASKFSRETILILAAFCLIILPFVLPQMQGRYYYQGEIVLFVLAFILPGSAWFAFIMQVVTMSTFYIAFAGADSHHWAFAVLSLGVVLVLIGLFRANVLLRKQETVREVIVREAAAN
ncbi:MAG: hypothetical protein LBN36_03955 [Clostridiales Family XIII bacterium]|jgi:Gpi18-like mannosyltransferase|nr:hypothetical protein [Clostridiales Family XIII bacterium]